MIKFGQLMRARRMLRAGQLGDGAILKADAVGVRLSPAVEARLADVRGYLPRIDLEALARLPAGTLGREYARHMRDNGLQPFHITAAVDADTLARNTFAARYAVTHDIFHLLLGFDTRWPGEMGVLAFAAAQGYSGVQKLGLVLAAVLYPLFAPREAVRTFRCLRAGWRLGRRAAFLLGVRFEAQWERPLADVRRELGLPEPVADGVGVRLAHAVA